MRSTGVRWVLGGVVALSVIWFGIRPGHRSERRTAPVENLPEHADDGSRRPPPASIASAERRDAPTEQARVPETAAPTAGVRASRRAGTGAQAGTAPTADVDLGLNPPDDIPTLGRMALNDPDPQRRAQAGILLAATENPAAVPLLHQVLSDADASVRHTLVKEIADLDFAPDTTIDLLSPVAMKDSETGNRIAALETLAGIGGDRVTALATRLRRDRDEDVRILAEKILHPPPAPPDGAAADSD
jgi:HEAT repeat protein